MATPFTLLYPTALDSLDSLGRVNDIPQTSLDGTISSGASTITALDTSAFESSGSLVINSEQIYYTSKTSFTFTGCLRGRNGTAASAHTSGAVIKAPILAAHRDVLVDGIMALQGKVGSGLSNAASFPAGYALITQPDGTTLWAPQSGATGPQGPPGPNGTGEYLVTAYASLASAVAAIGSTPGTLVIDSIKAVSADLTIPKTLILRFTNAGGIQPANTKIVTILSDGSGWPVRQIFFNSTAGQGIIRFTGNVSTTHINTNWWGSLGDGTTDCTPAFWAADAAAQTFPNGVQVDIPGGVFRSTNSNTFTGTNIHVRGSGRGITIIRGVAGAYAGRTVSSNLVYATLALVAADSCSISGLTVDNQTNGTLANDIMITAGGANGSGTVTRDSIVKDCHVLLYNSHQYGIWELRGVDNKIVNNWVDGGVTSSDGASEQEGIESYGGNGTMIALNHVKNIGASGINIIADTSVISAPINNITVVNNHISTSRVGVAINVGEGATLQGVAVHDNPIKTIWDWGVSIGVNTDATLLKDVSVKNNLIADVGLIGIRMYGDEDAGTVPMENINIESNPINTVSGLGALIFWMRNVNFRSNSTLHINDIGVLVQNSSRIKVNDNYIEDTQNEAVYVGKNTSGSSDTVDVFRNAIKDWNQVDGSKAGILVVDADRVSVDANVFESVVNQYYAIYAPNDTVTNFYLGDNHLKYIPTVADVFRNDSEATTTNEGTFNIPEGTTDIVVPNPFISEDSKVFIEQVSGSPTAITKVTILGNIIVTQASASPVGGRMFRYVV